MRRLVLAILGLAGGAALSSWLSTGCSCPAPPPMAAGTYLPACLVEPDYKFVLATDKTTATESFTRNGKAYVINYNVVP